MWRWLRAAVAYREDDDEQEVDVGDIMKLEPYVFGDETQGGIFGGSDLVADKGGDGVAFFVARIVRQWLVEEDATSGAGFFFTRGLFRTGLWLFWGRVEICSCRVPFVGIDRGSAAAGKTSEYRLALVPGLGTSGSLRGPS